MILTRKYEKIKVLRNVQGTVYNLLFYHVAEQSLKLKKLVYPQNLVLVLFFEYY